MSSSYPYKTGNAWLLSYQKKYWGRLLAGTLFVLVSTCFSVFVPNQVGQAIDYLRLPGPTVEGVMVRALIIIVFSFISGIFL
ncbi:MAG TPA: hypothetical protein VEF04_18225, partial [Blastocatellia bacterium]|nr:hypothetical protein [Blastocatellia bacterium]